jgi:hypothetical protein
MNMLRIDFAEYQAIPRLNASTLVHGQTSMRALRHAIHGRAKPPTKALRFGSKYHELILEPEEFERRFCVMPNYAAMPENVTGKGEPSTSWGTTFCKESKTSFETMARLEGKEVITREEYDRGLCMCEAIAEKPGAVEIIRSCEKEVTLLGEIDGVPVKGRLDLCGSLIIADLKGTKSCDPQSFGRDAANFRYGFKMAFYRELYRQNFMRMPRDGVKVIAVETGGVFDCCVVSMPLPVLENGFSDVQRVIAEYKRCKETDVWPGVDRGQPEVELYVPPWSMPIDDDAELDWSDLE